VARIASLAVKAGAVAVILELEPQFSIDLQLIGGVIILQTLPAVVLGLWTRWFHRWALLLGWAAGLVTGLSMLYVTPNAANHKHHFGGSLYQLSKLGFDTKNTIYPGLAALLVNLAVAIVLTPVLRGLRAKSGTDGTVATDYRPAPVGI
jgi:SSS family solute:Na+ symporter